LLEERTLALSTLDDEVLYTGELLVSMAGAMKREFLPGSYIQADETPLGVQTHDKCGRNHQLYCVAVWLARKRSSLRLPYGP